MSTPRPKKSQKEKPVEIDMTPDELLQLMLNTSPVTQEQLKKKKAASSKKEKKG